LGRRVGFVIAGGKKESVRQDFAASGSIRPASLELSHQKLAKGSGSSAQSLHAGDVGFPRRVRQTLPENEHAVMLLDQACWHSANALEISDDVIPVTLPPYSPELNPVERLWRYLRQRFLSLLIFEDQEAIIEASCQAWNAFADDAERTKSLCLQPWIRKVI
jgi:hypothetical protein